MGKDVWPPNRPWSYSALDGFEVCPKNYYLTRVTKGADKVVDTDRPGLGSGSDIHKQIENYIQNGTPLPIGLRKFVEIIDRVTKGARDVITEGRSGLTSDLRVTGFFGEDVSCRLVIDMLSVFDDSSILLDWKSSSAPRESEDQLWLYAMYALCKYPRHIKAHAGFVYTKFPTRKLTMVREQIPEVAERFRPRIEALDDAHATGHWPERPGWKCKFCPVTSCVHNKLGKR